MKSDAVVCVAGDLLAPAVCLVDNSFDLIERQRGLRVELALLVDPGAMGHVNLDPVRAVVKLLARSLASLNWSIDELCALRHVDLWRIAFQGIAASGRDCARDDEHARPGNESTFDGLLDADIAISGAFGLDIANR